MNANRYLRCCFCVALLSIVMFSCSKMDDNYKEFIKGGEILYTGKADSLKVFPGNERIALSWQLISDPKISKSVVYWNNRADSLIINVQRSSGIDNIYRIIEPLPQGTYTFEVYNFDNEGHKSIKAETIGQVFGENYINSLFNRPVKSLTMGKSDTAVVAWLGASQQSVGVDVRYKNKVGELITMFAPASDEITKLPNFTAGDSIMYRTLYKPMRTAIDTFYSSYEYRKIPF